MNTQTMKQQPFTKVLNLNSNRRQSATESPREKSYLSNFSNETDHILNLHNIILENEYTFNPYHIYHTLSFLTSRCAFYDLYILCESIVEKLSQTPQLLNIVESVDAVQR